MNDNEFKTLYLTYAGRLTVFAKRFVRETAVAEDIVADSFVKLYNNTGKLRQDTSPESYLFTIVRNSCLDHLKLQQIHARIEGRLADSAVRLQNFDIQSLNAMNPSEVFATEVQRLMDSAEGSMPELTRKVFLKSREEGKTYQEIAAELNITPRRVHTEMQRALGILREYLKDYLPAWLLALYLQNFLQ